MNKATLIFVSNNPDDIAKTKQKFVEYFGTRMVEDNNPYYPILRMSSTVDGGDMNNLSAQIPEDMTVLVFIEDESIDVVAHNYLYIKAN